MLVRATLGCLFVALALPGVELNKGDDPPEYFASERVSPLVAAALLPVDKPIGVCAWCDTCEEEEMKLEALEQRGEIHDQWESQPCVEEVCSYREWCDVCEDDPPPEWCIPDPPAGGEDQPMPAPSEEELKVIWNTIVAEDTAEIRDVIGAYPQHVVINVERQAIQVLGCAGVLLNVPMSPKLLVDLVGVS